MGRPTVQQRRSCYSLLVTVLVVVGVVATIWAPAAHADDATQQDFQFDATSSDEITASSPINTESSRVSEKVTAAYEEELTKCESVAEKLMLTLVLRSHNWDEIIAAKQSRAVLKLAKFFNIDATRIHVGNVQHTKLYTMARAGIRQGANNLVPDLNAYGVLEFQVGCGNRYFASDEPIVNQIRQQMDGGIVDDLSGLQFGWWLIWSDRRDTAENGTEGRTPRRTRRAASASSAAAAAALNDDEMLDDGSGEDDYDYDEEESITESAPIDLHPHRHHHGAADDLAKQQFNSLSSDGESAPTDQSLLTTAIDPDIKESVIQLQSDIKKTIENNKRLKDAQAEYEHLLAEKTKKSEAQNDLIDLIAATDEDDLDDIPLDEDVALPDDGDDGELDVGGVREVTLQSIVDDDSLLPSSTALIEASTATVSPTTTTTTTASKTLAKTTAAKPIDSSPAATSATTFVPLPSAAATPPTQTTPTPMTSTTTSTTSAPAMATAASTTSTVAPAAASVTVGSSVTATSTAASSTTTSTPGPVVPIAVRPAEASTSSTPTSTTTTTTTTSAPLTEVAGKKPILSVSPLSPTTPASATEDAFYDDYEDEEDIETDITVPKVIDIKNNATQTTTVASTTTTPVATSPTTTAGTTTSTTTAVPTTTPATTTSTTTVAPTTIVVTTPSTTTTTTTTTTPAPTTTTAAPTTTTSTTTEFIEPEPLNNAPTIRNRLPKQPVTAGKPFHIAVPLETFADAEDGTNLQLQLLDRGDHPLRANSWIQFNAETREIYGLPLEDAVSKWQFHLRATDSGNETVTESLDIAVQQHKSHRSANHEVTALVRLQQPTGTASPSASTPIDWQLRLLRSVCVALGDSYPGSIVVREVRPLGAPSQQEFAFVFTNDALPKDKCPDDADLERLFRPLTAAALGDRSLLVKSVVAKPIGPCAKLETPKPKPAKPTPQMTKNYPPVPRNQVDRVNATIGQLLVFKVPLDTFYDPEDNTDLKLALLTMDRAALDPKHWLQFDAKNAEFYGIPKQGDYGQREYLLVAEDREGLTATDALVVDVGHAAHRDSTGIFEMQLRLEYEHFNGSAIQRRFVERIAQIFGDPTTAHIQIRAIHKIHQTGGTMIKYFNNTLHRPHHICPAEAIDALRAVLLHPNGETRQRVVDTLGAEFALERASVILNGACLAPIGGGAGGAERGMGGLGGGVDHDSHYEHKGTAKKPAQQPAGSGGFLRDDYLLTFVLPAVIIATMLVFATVVACVLHRRRMTGKMELGDEEERRSFRSKGIPVIFHDELDEKPETGNKSPVILKDEKPPLLPPSYNSINPEDHEDMDEYVPPPAVVMNGRESRGKSPVTPSYRKPPPYVSP